MKFLYTPLLILSLFIPQIGHSQSVTASASTLLMNCGGGPVQLDAVGITSSTIFGDDFNSGILTSGWTTSPAAQFNNPCGASFDGSTYLWMGSSTSAPRTLGTSNVDVACGGTVCFDFKFMCEYCGDTSPCEGADFYNEGVSLQYSLNNGATWTDIAYFAPNGNLLTNYPGAGASAPIANGATVFTTWNNYCFNVPAGAFSASTQFRLYQWGSSGSAYDHWGIDNFYITAIPCSPFYYDWSHIPGFPDAASVTTNVTQTTTFTVDYTDGTTTYTDQITVVVDNLEFDTIMVDTPSCYGLQDAGIIATMLNGQAPYTYTLTGAVNISNTTGLFPNLQGGLYVLQVIDNLGCPVITNINIPQGPSCCEVTAVGTDPSCDGLINGNIISTPFGGIPAYLYQWFDMTNTPLAGQVYQSIGNIGSGTYVIEITDVSGCVNRDTVTITAPAPINGNLNVSQIDCFGVCDGNIDFQNSTGGSTPYSYSLNGAPAVATNVFPNLCQGNYTINLIDANNCQFQLNTVINQPSNLVLFDTLINKEICNGGDGEIYMNVSGGTPGYTYTLGATTNSTGIFTNLLANTYAITVTDGNGCTETVNIVLQNIPAPNPMIDYQQDVACAGGLNGAVTIVVSITTGTSPFTYDIDMTGPGPTNTFNVSAGSHTVVVADANNCSGSITFNIGQPTPLSFTTTKTDATCFGVCNGTITVNSTGGTAPYTYSKNNGSSYQNSNILTGLCLGNINVVVKDANGCLANSTVVITEPTQITSSNSIVDPTCFNGCDGSISFGVTAGGTPTYQYSINNGASYQASQFFTNICSGTYNLIVKDLNNCEITMPNIVLTNPAQITFNTISENGSNCGFSNGGFEVQAVNGTPAYTYSLNSSFTPSQANGNYNGTLPSGIYTVYAQDANGCIDTIRKSVNDLEITTALDSTHNVTCFGGTDGGIFVSVIVGVAPYTYTLDSVYFQSTGIFDGATNPNVSVTAGTHFVIIHDSGNCSNFYEFTITQPDSITYNANLVHTSCLGGVDGEITFTNVLGGDGGPYTYSIDGGITYQVSNSFTNLGPGIYNTMVMDGNGCLGAISVDITQPTNISLSVNPTHLICNSDNSGSMILVANGGAGSFNYDIGSANNNTGVFLGLAAGAYNLHITDANGCPKDTIYNLTEPTALSVTLIVQDNSCFGDCNGVITVSASGGTPPLLYSADNGVSQQSSNILQALCNGNHAVEVEDFRHCIFTVNQIVTSPAALTINLVGAAATCGNNNGEITVNIGGGLPVYSYSISSDNGITFSVPVNTNIFNNLAPGSYIIKATDANLCEIESFIIITADDEPTIDFIQTTNILCNADNDGTITVTSGLGVGIHEYSLDNILFQPANIFNSLAAANYNVYVRDANGCIAQSVAIITEPNVLNANSDSTDLICNNDYSGQISIVPTGGTPNFSYSIDGGTTYQPVGNYTSLSANTYTTIVIDANNCSDTIVLTLDEPAVISTNLAITNVSCFGECDGSIDLAPTGGTGTLTYQWSSNIALPNSPIANNVCAGNYDAIITDANGCFLEEFNIPVTEPIQLVINSVIVTNADCYNNCTGQIVINSSLGVSYEIINNGISTVSPTNTFTNLCDDNYDIIVTDAIGCKAFSNTTVTEPDTLIGNPPSDWIDVCYGSSINVSAGYTTGGTTPYSFDWVDLLGNSYPATGVFTQTVTQNNTYTFNITDANGCTAGSYSFNMTVTAPLTLSLSSNTLDVCPSDSAMLTAIASGGQFIDFGDTLGYSYSWSPATIIDTINTLTVYPPDTTTYTVSVTDYCNAIVSQNVTINVYPDPTPVIIGGDTACAPYSLVLENSNFFAGNNNWLFSNGYSTSDPYGVIFEEPGCYDVTVSVTTDQSIGSCYGDTTILDAICINPLPKADFEFTSERPLLSDFKIDFHSTSIGEETYYWTFGGYGESYDSSTTFKYSFDKETVIYTCLTVETNFGCEDKICKTILIEEDLIFYVPNSFTPDIGDVNNIFKPIFSSGFDPYQYELLIFDRWGEIVFQSKNSEYGWNGQYGNKDVNQAVYVWKINYIDKYKGTDESFTGHVTLLR